MRGGAGGKRCESFRQRHRLVTSDRWLDERPHHFRCVKRWPVVWAVVWAYYYYWWCGPTTVVTIVNRVRWPVVWASVGLGAG